MVSNKNNNGQNNKLPIILSIISFVVALAALGVSISGNSIACSANNISQQANQISDNANRLAQEANNLAKLTSEPQIVYTIWTITGYPDFDGTFVQDDVTYIPGYFGDFSFIDGASTTVVKAGGMLLERWESSRTGKLIAPFEQPEDEVYLQHFQVLVIENVGAATAENFTFDYDYYQIIDFELLRETKEPLNILPQRNHYNPQNLEPGAKFIIPLCSVYLNTHPVLREFDLMYVDEVWIPKNYSYISSVSGVPDSGNIDLQNCANSKAQFAAPGFIDVELDYGR